MTQKRFKAEDAFGRVFTFYIERLDTDDKAPWLLHVNGTSRVVRLRLGSESEAMNHAQTIIDVYGLSNLQEQKAPPEVNPPGRNPIWT